MLIFSVSFQFYAWHKQPKYCFQVIVHREDLSKPLRLMHEYSIDFIKVTSCLVSSQCTFGRFICYNADFPIQDLFGTHM